jgi:hypothetical protein
MRKHIAGIAAAAAAATLIGLGASSATASEDNPGVDVEALGTFHSGGTLLYCKAPFKDGTVRAFLVQGDSYDVFDVQFNGRSFEGTSPVDVPDFIFGNTVDGSAVTGGKTVTVTGKLKRTGEVKNHHEDWTNKRTGVREVVDGTITTLKPKLKLTYDGVTAKLTCESAIDSDLTTTRTQTRANG